MCLVIPLKIIRQKNGGWVMEDGRVVKKMLIGKVEKGDYLICRQDMGVEKLSKKDALQMRRLLKGVSDELRKRH